MNVVAGTSHTIAVTSPQAAGAGAQRVFTNWSDGGAISHSVIPTNNVTYTASFVLAATQPSKLTSPSVPGAGAFSFAFTNVPGASFTVLAGTNLSQSVSNWTHLSSATESPAGHYQFNNPPAANFPVRFYDVRSP